MEKNEYRLGITGEDFSMDLTARSQKDVDWFIEIIKKYCKFEKAKKE